MKFPFPQQEIAGADFQQKKIYGEKTTERM